MRSTDIVEIDCMSRLVLDDPFFDHCFSDLHSPHNHIFCFFMDLEFSKCGYKVLGVIGLAPEMWPGFIHGGFDKS